MTNVPNARSADLGSFVPPSPAADEQERPSEGGPHQRTYVGHKKSADELPPSDRGQLAPAFQHFSKMLTADLERDSRQREANLNEAFGITPEAILRARLGDAVRSGEFSEAEAARYWQLKFPGVHPEDAK